MLNALVSNFPVENLIIWLGVGLVAGSVIFLIDRRNVRGGFLATTVTGMLGAMLGGFLSALLFGIAPVGISAPAIILAILGGLTTSFIQRVAVETEEERVLRPQEAEPGAAPQFSSPVYYSQIYPSRTKGESSVDPTQLEKYLKGVEFPTNREGLIKNALQMGVDEEVINALEKLPDQNFHSSVDVGIALGSL